MFSLSDLQLESKRFTDRDEIKPWLSECLILHKNIHVVIERSDKHKIILKCKSPANGKRETGAKGANARRQNTCPFKLRANFSRRNRVWALSIINEQHDHPLDLAPGTDSPTPVAHHDSMAFKPMQSSPSKSDSLPRIAPPHDHIGQHDAVPTTLDELSVPLKHVDSSESAANEQKDTELSRHQLSVLQATPSKSARNEAASFPDSSPKVLLHAPSYAINTIVTHESPNKQLSPSEISKSDTSSDFGSFMASSHTPPLTNTEKQAPSTPSELPKPTRRKSAAPDTRKKPKVRKLTKGGAKSETNASYNVTNITKYPKRSGAQNKGTSNISQKLLQKLRADVNNMVRKRILDSSKLTDTEKWDIMENFVTNILNDHKGACDKSPKTTISTHSDNAFNHAFPHTEIHVSNGTPQHQLNGHANHVKDSNDVQRYHHNFSTDSLATQQLSDAHNNAQSPHQVSQVPLHLQLSRNPSQDMHRASSSQLQQDQQTQNSQRSRSEQQSRHAHRTSQDQHEQQMRYTQSFQEVQSTQPVEQTRHQEEGERASQTPHSQQAQEVQSLQHTQTQEYYGEQPRQESEQPDLDQQQNDLLHEQKDALKRQHQQRKQHQNHQQHRGHQQQKQQQHHQQRHHQQHQQKSALTSWLTATPFPTNNNLAATANTNLIPLSPLLNDKDTDYNANSHPGASNHNADGHLENFSQLPGSGIASGPNTYHNSNNATFNSALGIGIISNGGNNASSNQNGFNANTFMIPSQNIQLSQIHNQAQQLPSFNSIQNQLPLSPNSLSSNSTPSLFGVNLGSSSLIPPAGNNASFNTTLNPSHLLKSSSSKNNTFPVSATQPLSGALLNLNEFKLSANGPTANQVPNFN